MKNIEISTVLLSFALCLIICIGISSYNCYHVNEQIAKDWSTRSGCLNDFSLDDSLKKYCSNEKEREALRFIYAYMPLGDIADYSTGFFAVQAECSLSAQKEMPWGGKIPGVIFRHFVLPIIVNNETIETARLVMFRSLKIRGGICICRIRSYVSRYPCKAGLYSALGT
jgi:hypothetical protein